MGNPSNTLITVGDYSISDIVFLPPIICWYNVNILSRE